MFGAVGETRLCRFSVLTGCGCVRLLLFWRSFFAAAALQRARQTQIFMSGLQIIACAPCRAAFYPSITYILKGVENFYWPKSSSRQSWADWRQSGSFRACWYASWSLVIASIDCVRIPWIITGFFFLLHFFSQSSRKQMSVDLWSRQLLQRPQTGLRALSSGVCHLCRWAIFSLMSSQTIRNFPNVPSWSVLLLFCFFCIFFVQGRE